MTQEERQLLLTDLCARIPYRLNVCLYKETCVLMGIDGYEVYLDIDSDSFRIESIKPYLRKLSSMTEEEKEELLNLLFDKEAKYFYIDDEGCIDGKTSDLMKEGLNYPSFCPINIVLYTNWLNSHHFDFRGLINKGLALKAPKGMYK